MRLLACAVLAACSSLAAAAAAQAGTLSVSGTTITYAAAPGEENFLTVNWGNSGADDSIPTFTDHAPITAVAPCQEWAGGFECPSAGEKPQVVVRLGDRNDFAQSINDRAVGQSVQLYGEDGDDDLDSDASADLLDGGPGNDEMTPDDNDPGGGDVVVGGPGEDTLQTGNPTGATGPIGVSFDGVANDGYPGEADSYAPDLENLSAPATAPSIAFVGTDARNVVQLRSQSPDSVTGLGGDDLIDGANGNDTLDGGAGNDTIHGGGNDDTIVGGPGVDSLNGEGSGSGLYVSIAGNDRIDARDGEAESLNCGPGADTAIVDALDTVPQDPGSLCEVVDRPAAVQATPPGPAPIARAASVRSTKLTARRNRVAVTVACPAGGTACTGKVTLRTASKVKVGKRRRTVTLGSASYTVPAGRSKAVSVRVGPTGRSLLRRKRKVRVRVTVSTTGAKASRRTVTLRRR